MNWTGGDLSRAAPTKAKALQSRQKAHFARARAGALQRSELTQAALPSRDRHHTQSSSWRSIDPVEHQLLEKRQELLHRSDWLSLRPTKPVRLRFETGSDKAKVGRRRRLNGQTRHVHKHKSHRAPVDCAQRSFGVHRMTPADQESSLRIKLGTDALDSGIQTTRSIQERDKIDQRSDLSEEPMLLDCEDDFAQWYTSEQPDIDPRQEYSPLHHDLHITSRDVQSPETPIQWSTSVLEAHSEAGDAAGGLGEGSLASKQRHRHHISPRGHIDDDNTSMLAHCSRPSFSAIASPSLGTPTVPTIDSVPRRPSKISRQAATCEENLVLQKSSAQTLIHPRLERKATEVARMQPGTPAQNDEDEDRWRRFMLGCSRGASASSSTNEDYSQDTMLTSEIVSVGATRGASSVFHGFARPYVPPTTRTDRTTAAIASSSSM